MGSLGHHIITRGATWATRTLNSSWGIQAWEGGGWGLEGSKESSHGILSLTLFLSLPVMYCDTAFLVYFFHPAVGSLKVGLCFSFT